MLGITLAQGLIYVAYITFLMIKFKGPLSSISQSWYELKDPWKLLFTVFTWSIGILMFYQGDPMDPSYKYFVLSALGLVFVGTMTMFREKNSPIPWFHNIGAAIGILSALIGIGTQSGGWLPLILFIPVALIIKFSKIKNETWWIENVAFLSIIAGFLIY